MHPTATRERLVSQCLTSQCTDVALQGDAGPPAPHETTRTEVDEHTRGKDKSDKGQKAYKTADEHIDGWLSRAA